MNKFSLIASTFLMGSLFIGCGGGGGTTSTSSTTSSTQTGVFIDAPVAGIEYNTSSGLQGVTDNLGQYKYNKGDKISFKLGNVVLGTSLAKQVVTPVDIVENNQTLATHIAYILQNLDIDGNLTNGINLPDPDNIKNSLTDINLSDEGNITSVVKKLKEDLNETYPEIDDYEYNITEAQNNMENDINEYSEQENIVTVLSGFPSGYLNGKTFYLIHKYTGDPDLEKYGWVDDIKLTFDENEMHVYPDGSAGNNENQDVSYTITDNGELNVSGEISKVVEVTDDYIKLEKENGEPSWLFFDKESADEFLNEYFSYKNSFEIGKKYYHIYSPNGIGMILESEFTFKDENTIDGISYQENNQSFTLNLSYENDYRTLIVQNDPNDPDDIDKCFIDEKTEDYMKDICYNVKWNEWSVSYNFYDKEKANEFINKYQTQINPANLKGQILYKFSTSGIAGIKLNDTNITRYWLNTNGLNLTDINLSTILPDDCNYSYSLKYLDDNLTLEINGTDCNGDAEYNKNYVYEVNLTGKKIDPVLIYNGNTNLIDSLNNGGYITFSKGKAYCTLLWGECWLDEEAMQSIFDYIKSSSSQP